MIPESVCLSRGRARLGKAPEDPRNIVLDGGLYTPTARGDEVRYGLCQITLDICLSFRQRYRDVRALSHLTGYDFEFVLVTQVSVHLHGNHFKNGGLSDYSK